MAFGFPCECIQQPAADLSALRAWLATPSTVKPPERAPEPAGSVPDDDPRALAVNERIKRLRL